MKIKAFSLIILVIWSFSASAANQISADQAWVRAAPPGSMMMAGYVTLTNKGTEKATITGAWSDQFGTVETHQTFTENGVSRMEFIPEIDILPGESVHFEPGGKHLMLMQPEHSPKMGEVITITLCFKDDSKLKIKLPVMRRAPEN
ncbi:MAG: copper chaperone PCu(A)C [bacterium]